MPQFPEYPVPHRGIEQHVHVPPMLPVNIPAEIGEIPYPTTGQPARFPIAHHQIIMGQMMPHAEALIPTDRVYYASYNRVIEAHCCTACPPPYIQQNYVPVPTYTTQETPVVTEEMFNPAVTPEMVNAGPASPVYLNQRVDPLSDAVWAPNPGEILSPRVSSLPPIPVSPVESTWSGNYGTTGVHSPAGTNGVPVAPTAADGSKANMVLVRRLPAERTNERSAASKAYQISELDDQELEASLQALERRIDTELFTNVD